MVNRSFIMMLLLLLSSFTSTTNEALLGVWDQQDPDGLTLEFKENNEILVFDKKDQLEITGTYEVYDNILTVKLRVEEDPDEYQMTTTYGIGENKLIVNIKPHDFTNISILKGGDTNTLEGDWKYVSKSNISNMAFNMSLKQDGTFKIITSLYGEDPVEGVWEKSENSQELFLMDSTDSDSERRIIPYTVIGDAIAIPIENENEKDVIEKNIYYKK